MLFRSRQEYWNGWSFPSPGDLPNPGIEPGSPALQADSLPSESPGKPPFMCICTHTRVFQLRVLLIFIVVLILISLMIGASLIAQSVKSLPAMQETQVQSLGWEDPVEKEMATHSSTLAWRIPWTEEPGGLQSTGLQNVGHD